MLTPQRPRSKSECSSFVRRNGGSKCHLWIQIAALMGASGNALIRLFTYSGRSDMRHCGGCTACCEGWLRAEDLDMRPGKACKHKTSGGCAIYSDRPEDPCKTFRCGWLQSPDLLDEEFRPDRCGAILLTGRPEAGYEVWRLVPIGRVVSEKTLLRFRELTESMRMPLVWNERSDKFAEGDSSRTTFCAGSEEFISAIKWEFSDEQVWDLATQGNPT